MSICPICKNAFEVTWPGQRYCSKQCKTKANNERQKEHRKQYNRIYQRDKYAQDRKALYDRDSGL